MNAVFVGKSARPLHVKPAKNLLGDVDYLWAIYLFLIENGRGDSTGEYPSQRNQYIDRITKSTHQMILKRQQLSSSVSLNIRILPIL